MINFYEIQEKHLQEVRSIYNEYVAHTTVSFDIEPASIEKIRELTKHSDPRFSSFVIVNESHVIGYVLLSPFIKKHGCTRTAEITIYLKAEFKGRGIGKLAVQFIEEQARERGFHTLIAVICTENEASMAAFKSQGYMLKGILEQVAYKFDRFLDVAYMSKML